MSEHEKEIKPQAKRTLEDLLVQQNELALKKDQREQAEYEVKVANEAEAKRQRQFAKDRFMTRDKQKIEESARKISRCDHLSGRGAFRQTSASAGGKFNLYAHQLPGGQYFIGCRNKCGLKLFQGDTATTLFRTDGANVEHQYVNPSNMSFEDAWNRLPADSVSRSEVTFVKAGDPAPAVTR